MRAIYATIVLTAALVGLHEHAESARDVLAVLVVAALTLFVAHTFSDLLSRRVDVEGGVPMEEIREVLIVELPLLIAAGIPALIFLLAHAGATSVDAAFWASLVYAIAVLFVVGAMAASDRTVVRRLLASGVFAVLGVAMIAAEAAVH